MMKPLSMTLRLTVATILLTSLSHYVVGDEEGSNYGVDVSWPMHHAWTEASSKPLNDERRAVYEDFMNGCREKYQAKGNLCDNNEQGRLDMTLRQPQSMVNYTSTGFMKIQAPEAVRKLLSEHWERNKHKRNDKGHEERWSAGNIYTNNWAAPSYMVSVEDHNLHGAGADLKQQIWDAAKDTIEQWTGMEIKPTSMYGIRVYTEGAILAPHVDRLPLVSSCIVNVAQDLDEPWPLEVIDREGKAVNVTMEPGDMVLYESHSLIHGRPFPLKGRYFANIFIHFEPTGNHVYHRMNDPVEELVNGLPPYIIEGSLEESHWRQENPNGWKMQTPSAAHVDTPEGHMAAINGDTERLAKIAEKNAKLLHHKDRNGWQPIHEAARAGHKEVIAFLLEKGADMNARTHFGEGNTPLNIAIDHLSEKHPVSQYLMSLGALDIGHEPDL